METFDLNQTLALADLLEVPEDNRDDLWRANFFRAVPNASLASFEPQIEIGPDSFPYFQLAMPDAGAFTPFSIVHILNDVLQDGVGVVIHSNTSRDEKPAWVFTLGDMVSYSLFQDFEGDPAVYKNSEPPPADSADREILRAVPSEEYFPAGPRAAMGGFLRANIHLPGPRIGLVTGASLRPRQSLMVNLRASYYDGDTKTLNAAMDYLTWFIPKTYSVMVLPEDWSDEGMAPI